MYQITQKNYSVVVYGLYALHFSLV